MPQCIDILTFIGDKGNWIHCSTSIWYYHFKSPCKIRPQVSHVLPFSILTLQFVHRSEIYSSTSLPSSKLISASIRLHNALWFHSVAVQTAVSTEKMNVCGKCVFIVSAPMSVCVRTWLLCFPVHKPFIKLVLMGLGLCCQLGKWSVTEADSEPQTCSCCNKGRVFLIFLEYILYIYPLHGEHCLLINLTFHVNVLNNV